MDREFRLPRAFARLTAVTSALLSLSGCASVEYNRYKTAQADYESCLQQGPASADHCGELRNAVNDRFNEYERASRARWSCDKDTGRCSDSVD